MYKRQVLFLERKNRFSKISKIGKYFSAEPPFEKVGLASSKRFLRDFIVVLYKLIPNFDLKLNSNHIY